MKNILVLVLLGVVSPAAADDYAAVRQRLDAAYQREDMPALEAAARAALALRPGHPTLHFALALAHARQQRPRQACAALMGLLRRDVAMPARVKDDPAFAALRSLPEYPMLERLDTALRQARGTATRHASFGPGDTVPEGIAVAGDGTLYLTSVRHGGVLVRRTDGSMARWPTPGWSTLGIHLTPDEETLWVAAAALPQLARPGQKDGGQKRDGQTALLAFDARDGTLRAAHRLARAGKHVLGDFLLLADGTPLATDSAGGGVYRLDAARAAFVEVIAPGTLRSPQGIARIGDDIFIADYGNGIFRYRTGTGSLVRLRNAATAPYGIDGLYAHEGTLIAVQNGIAPHRVTRFGLSPGRDAIVSADILLMSHGAFDEPTLGQVAGDTFYLVANSHWNRFDAHHRLPASGLQPPVILSLPLAQPAR